MERLEGGGRLHPEGTARRQDFRTGERRAARVKVVDSSWPAAIFGQICAGRKQRSPKGDDDDIPSFVQCRRGVEREGGIGEEGLRRGIRGSKMDGWMECGWGCDALGFCWVLYSVFGRREFRRRKQERRLREEIVSLDGNPPKFPVEGSKKGSSSGLRHTKVVHLVELVDVCLRCLVVLLALLNIEVLNLFITRRKQTVSISLLADRVSHLRNPLPRPPTSYTQGKKHSPRPEHHHHPSRPLHLRLPVPLRAVRS